MLKCRRCGCDLNKETWHPSLRKKNSKVCKACNLSLGNDWRKKNPDRSRAYAKKYYRQNPGYSLNWCRQNRKKIRAEMLLSYGGKCNQCGTDNPIVLDIDHVNNDGAVDRKNGLWGWRLYRWLRKNGYPKDRFQLLCRNCNWIKERTRKCLPHISVHQSSVVSCTSSSCAVICKHFPTPYVSLPTLQRRDV